jgi:hypothetical protein
VSNWTYHPDRGDLAEVNPRLILCDHLKSFDYRERTVTFINHVPDALVDVIVGSFRDLMDLA